MELIDREEVLRYAKERYGTEPEALWARFPDYAVLRRRESGKWYAVIMDVPRKKLGLDGDGRVDILDLKCDPLLVGSLREEKGVLPAYHMNKDRWIALLLDGSVPRDQVLGLLDLSYGITAG